jgi:cell division protein YceG involved in septum cleavage
MTPALIRLRRKAEIMRLDFKAADNPKYHDCNEMLTLIDIIEREMKNEKPS